MTINSPSQVDSKTEAPELSIFLPAYDEAYNLEELLPKIRQVVDELGISTQTIVIDAIEPIDNTPDVCARNDVGCLSRKGGNRYGDAVRTGIQATLGTYVISMDSDGSHNPEFIRELWLHRKEADVVIASRYTNGGVTENPWILVTMSRLLNIVFRVFVGMPIYDISNSFRLYKGDLLRTIHPQYANFDVLEEILARILWENSLGSVKIIEIPFRFEKRKHGRPKRNLLVFSAQFLLALFKLTFLRIKHQSSLRS